MPGPPRQPRIGVPVKRQPGAFPLFCDGRKPSVVTADVWAFLRHLASTRLAKAKEKQALAYLDQSRDFFEAASNPRLGSKPLLYYYAFLNLAKMALIVRGVALPQKVQHGISDPRANSKRRIRFSGQRVQWNGRANDYSELFAELLFLLDDSQRPIAGARSIKTLLKQIPTLQRTFCVVTSERNSFLPIESIKLVHGEGELWARICIRRADAEGEEILRRISARRAFRNLLSRVRAERPEEIWFETASVPGDRRGTDNGIRRLARTLRPLGIATILTNTGYRMYLSDIAPAQRLPQLATVYAIMFYLGSITRYRPHDFERIVDGGESWIVGEFFATQPAQVLYIIASLLSGRAVHRPYAIASA